VKLDNETKLVFYALFKQITEGENKTKAPSKLKVVEKYKWDAWKKLGKITKTEAMKKYVEELSKISPSWDQPKPKL
jgi:acyl-CoA-binding protein